MEITQQLRDYARSREAGNVEDARRQGLDEKSAEFRHRGGDLYIERP
jgi:hypothetical protein